MGVLQFTSSLLLPGKPLLVTGRLIHLGKLGGQVARGREGRGRITEPPYPTSMGFQNVPEYRPRQSSAGRAPVLSTLRQAGADWIAFDLAEDGQ
jgi:hypothetical protein